MGGRLGLFVLLGLGLACSAPPVGRAYSTWASLGTTLQPVTPIARQANLPPAQWPWAGTVSHHLLTNDLLEDWFKTLADRRPVETFVILSPSHWNLSTQTWSLTDGYWLTAGAPVRSDRDKVHELAARLGVPLDVRVFDPEHGISTLMPYIAKYFPAAQVVCIAYHGEPPVNQPLAERLEVALKPWFDADGRKRHFLLLSTDFAHHGNLEGTVLKDQRSAEFFAQPSFSRWNLVGCDNRPAIYTIARWLQPTDQATVLYHTNSWQLSGQDPTDITSYFFTFFSSPTGG